MRRSGTFGEKQLITPACHGGPLVHVARVTFRYADGQDVLAEGHLLVESQQSQVVLEGSRIELRMRRDDLHSSLDVAERLLVVRYIVLA